jgi:ubiquinone/menaquinone biosynthesis C-methylase UbiE/broad specificity phosphatase PhoE
MASQGLQLAMHALKSNEIQKINQQTSPAIDLPNPLPTSPTRLLLICHAESIQRRAGNVSLGDTGLTALGWEQATALADWLGLHEQIDHLVSNPQLRCRLTAQRISQSLNLRVLLESLFPPSPRQRWTVFTPPTGDAGREEELAEYNAYLDKVVNAFSHILSNRWGETTAVVTNANAIAGLIRCLNGGGSLGIHVDEVGISELLLADGHWRLVYANRREHLPRPPLETVHPREQPEFDIDLQEHVALATRVYNQLALTYSTEELLNEPDANGIPDKEFLRFADIQKGQRVLEVGSGLGQMTLALVQSGVSEAVGVDISPEMLEHAEHLRLSTNDPELLRRVNYRLAPAHDLPFSNNAFDVVLCRMILHHYAKPEWPLKEFLRVLKPNGVLVLAEVAGSEDPVKRATQNAIESKRNPSHVMIRTVEHYLDQLRAVGFEVEKEKLVKREQMVGPWLDELAVDKGTRQAVLEMLEASIETDAAELHVHRKNDDLVFDQRIVYLLARKSG